MTLDPRQTLPHKDSVENLREGVAKMQRKRRINPADYGPILVWPETITVLLDNYERVDVLLDHITSLEARVSFQDTKGEA